MHAKTKKHNRTVSKNTGNVAGSMGSAPSMRAKRTVDVPILTSIPRVRMVEEIPHTVF